MGKPKYTYGQKVTFSVGDKQYVGEVFIIDLHGTFERPGEPSYDIMVQDKEYVTDFNPEGKCLFKHWEEKLVSPYEEGIKSNSGKKEG